MREIERKERGKLLIYLASYRVKLLTGPAKHRHIAYTMLARCVYLARELIAIKLRRAHKDLPRTRASKRRDRLVVS